MKTMNNPYTKSTCQISKPAFLLIGFSIAGSAILILLFLIPYIMKSMSPITGKVILALFFFLIVSIGAAETVARIWLDFRANKKVRFFCSLHPPKNIRTKLMKHHYLGHVNTPGYSEGELTHNTLGFRGKEIHKQKPSGVYRIACLGDSVTYGSSNNDNNDTFPCHLDKYLNKKNIEVINAGVPGWSSFEILFDLQMRVLELSPDLIILNFGINEVHSRLVDPNAYEPDNSGSRRPLPTFYIDGVLNHLALVRLIKNHLRIRRPPFTIFCGIVNITPTSYIDAFQKQKLDHTYPKGVFNPDDALSILNKNKPVYLEKNLKLMITIAREYGITVLLTTFPFSSLFSEEPRASSIEYVTAYREQNEMIKKIGSEKQIPVLDLAALIPEDRLYWADGRHLSPTGEQVKAEHIANFIKKMNWTDNLS